MMTDRSLTPANGISLAPQPDNQKRKVFVVDDHPLVREWLTNLINQQSDLMVCGEAASAAEAMQAPRNEGWPGADYGDGVQLRTFKSVRGCGSPGASIAPRFGGG